MSANEHPTAPMAKGRLIAATFGAAILALLIVLGAILPAEYNRDPLGVGKLSGLSRLWAADETGIDTKAGGAALAHEYATPFRTDVVEIPLGDFMSGLDQSTIEYKVRMTKDATLIYSWEVIGPVAARDFQFDQHGHTTPKAGEGMTVATYKQANGLKQQGSLIAPFDGIQGWQFANAGETGVIVKLRLAGFYELIPSGQPGNESGVVANVPADQARPTMRAAGP